MLIRNEGSKIFIGLLKKNLEVVRIAAYGGLTTDRPIPTLWYSLLSESQLLPLQSERNIKAKK